MITEKQKCIAEQMLFGLLFLHEETVTLAKYAFGKKLLYWRDIIDSKEKLILRPISDIAKETTHKGYNNNQPFIPLVELAKTEYQDFEYINIEVLDEKSIMCKGYSKMLSKLIMKEKIEHNCTYWFLPLSSARSDEERDLLHLWHFDTRNLIESGEAISTDEVNPYKV